MSGSIYLFVNHAQALRLGHVGWGIQLDADRFYYGSTDHLWQGESYLNLGAVLRYSSVAPEMNNDWWAEEGTLEQMLNAMATGWHGGGQRYHIRYHEYKQIQFEEYNPRAARQRADALISCGWHVLSNNCVHQTYSIYTAYGAGGKIPSPLADPTNLIPRIWFKRWHAERQRL